MKQLLDFVPLIIFFYLYKTTDPKNSQHPLLQLFGAGGADNNHILVATTGLLFATVLVYSILFVSQKFRLEKQQWFVLLMTVVFGGVTLALSDDYYIRLKAVLINLGFAAGLLISPWFIQDKQPVIKKLFEPMFDLAPKGWQRLNYAWAGMFFVMAGLHAFFAFVFMGGRYWGEFTAFGDMAVMFAFIIGMIIVLRQHIKKDIT